MGSAFLSGTFGTYINLQVFFSTCKYFWYFLLNKWYLVLILEVYLSFNYWYF